MSSRVHIPRTDVPPRSRTTASLHTASGRALTYYERLRRVERYVSLHYDEPISLQTAAEIASLERTYFSRYFHAKTGVCFREWLAEVRVRKATELFESSDLSVTQAAHFVGFNDLRTFERNFRKCTGMTPRDYIRAVRSP